MSGEDPKRLNSWYIYREDGNLTKFHYIVGREKSNGDSIDISICGKKLYSILAIILSDSPFKNEICKICQGKLKKLT